MADVGIVMPVYIQKPSFLNTAIHSILTQNHNDFRLIIVIDGAPEMINIAHEIINQDQRVEIVINHTNQGVAKSLNRGFDILLKDPQIKYLTWVSSDNRYYPNFVGTLRNELMKAPDTVGLVYSSFHYIDDNDNILTSEAEQVALRKYQAQPKEVLLDDCIIGVSFMYRAEYAKRIEGYKLEPVEDYEYWLRLTQHCDIKYIPLELVDYRVNSQFSISAQLQSSNQHRRWRYAFHLARYQARKRLQIPTELTVLFAVKNANDEIINRVENLYEQVYSNYYFCILDLSLDQQVFKSISNISHPTTGFKWFPNSSEKNAILNVLPAVITPYVYILDTSSFPNPMVLQVLMDQIKNADERLISNYYTNNYQLVGYRTHFSQPEPFSNELYRTNLLIPLLKQNSS